MNSIESFNPQNIPELPTYVDAKSPAFARTPYSHDIGYFRVMQALVSKSSHLLGWWDSEKEAGKTPKAFDA